MTGLEKMKSQILEDAKALADGRVADARSRAQEILEDAKAEAEKNAVSITQKSEAKVANYRERVASSADLQRRTKILAAKQKIISEVLDQAYERLRTMEEEPYFDMLLKILAKHVLPQEGVIYFSPADLKRMPSDFGSRVEKTAEEKGGSLTVSKEGRNIENGFVLAYGGIEENCVLKAMFDARRDELADKIHEIMFL